MAVRHPPVADGRTQASRVIPLVRSSELASATVTLSLTPSKESALPKRPPSTHVAPLIVPAFPLPELSAVAVPLPSSKPYSATRPAGGGAAEFSTVMATGSDVRVLLEGSRATAVTVCGPFGTERLSHWIEYGAVVSAAPAFTPSTMNCTEDTDTLSEASADSVTVLPT